MKTWKYKFLEKVLLGQNVDITDADSVIARCISLAYKDMLTAGRYYIKSNNVCADFKNILESNGYKFSPKLIEETSKLFGDSEKIGTENKYVTRFGLSQKLVNMTFKYLYIFNEYIGKEIKGKKIIIEACDCPLDSTILNKLKEKIAWSKCSKEQYVQCQDKIKQELKSKNLDSELESLGNLAYDFLNW